MLPFLVAACSDGSEGEGSAIVWGFLAIIGLVVAVVAAFVVVFVVTMATFILVARAFQWAWSGSRRD